MRVFKDQIMLPITTIQSLHRAAQYQIKHTWPKWYRSISWANSKVKVIRHWMAASIKAVIMEELRTHRWCNILSYHSLQRISSKVIRHKWHQWVAPLKWKTLACIWDRDHLPMHQDLDLWGRRRERRQQWRLLVYHRVRITISKCWILHLQHSS